MLGRVQLACRTLLPHTQTETSVLRHGGLQTACYDRGLSPSGCPRTVCSAGCKYHLQKPGLGLCVGLKEGNGESQEGIRLRVVLTIGIKVSCLIVITF